MEKRKAAIRLLSLLPAFTLTSSPRNPEAQKAAQLRRKSSGEAGRSAPRTDKYKCRRIDDVSTEVFRRSSSPSLKAQENLL